MEKNNQVLDPMIIKEYKPKTDHETMILRNWASLILTVILAVILYQLLSHADHTSFKELVENEALAKETKNIEDVEES